MTDMEKKLAFLLATSPHLDTLSGSYDEAARDLVANGVVPVVRCKDCKLWDPDPDTYGDSIGPKGKCMKSFETMICDDFCSYGERRADDEREA